MASKTLLFFGFFLLSFVIIYHVRHLPNNTVFKIYFKTKYGGSKLTHRRLFVDYLRRFNKSYSYGSVEYNKRLKYFKKNLIKIRKLNVPSSHATYGVTKFSDWSDEELSQMLSPAVGGCRDQLDNCTKPIQYGKTSRQTKNKRRFSDSWIVPDRKDWRDYHAIGHILDQKRCPVCWAFSTVGVMESMAFIQGLGPLTRLSVQNLIDCSFNQMKDKTGCRQGRPLIQVFEYLCHGANRRTVATEADYPLTFDEEECKGVDAVRSLKSYVFTCDMNEDRLVEAVSRGPVTAVVDGDLLYNYVEGVINQSCKATQDTVNHAVQIVGYDRTASPPFYIVRNSWGDDWGEGGYMRLAIGGNQCGIACTIGELEVY